MVTEAIVPEMSVGEEEVMQDLRSIDRRHRQTLRFLVLVLFAPDLLLCWRSCLAVEFVRMQE